MDSSSSSSSSSSSGSRQRRTLFFRGVIVCAAAAALNTCRYIRTSAYWKRPRNYKAYYRLVRNCSDDLYQKYFHVSKGIIAAQAHYPIRLHAPRRAAQAAVQEGMDIREAVVGFAFGVQ
ncbi:hypothetical protein QJQ45_011099 [Haematococcus lacustris]|nr:hypothetical protein QJQ45_011099 [Haematococcus lacustris]